MTMRPKSWIVLSDCLETGFKHGVNRLFKHRSSDSISYEDLLEEMNKVVDEQLNAISEYFSFDEVYDKE